MLGSAQIIHADARHLPIPDDSVDLICTSPPYLNLRSYQDSGGHYDGQIGSESSRHAFLDSLLEVTRECVRVLKPTGSLFVNLGDSFRDKSLQLTPERYRIRCVDELGLIARSVIVWSKPNGLPESVTDRVRRSHEDWVHFTLQPRYFSAVDEIREEHVYPNDTRHLRGGRRSINPDGSDAGGNTSTCNPLGKLPGSVWTIPTEPLRVPEHLGVDHFAAFPTEWPRRIIAGWSPAGVCVACGEGRRPVSVAGDYEQAGHGGNYAATEYGAGNHGTGGSTLRTIAARTITGYACACPSRGLSPDFGCPTCNVAGGIHYPGCDEGAPPTTPAVVLDPFCGTGTTALVAKALGRHGITIDMSADYCRLAQWRVNDPDQLAKAARKEKPPKQLDGQLDLLGDTA